MCESERCSFTHTHFFRSHVAIFLRGNFPVEKRPFSPSFSSRSFRVTAGRTLNFPIWVILREHMAPRRIQAFLTYLRVRCVRKTTKNDPILYMCTIPVRNYDCSRSNRFFDHALFDMNTITILIRITLHCVKLS